MEYYSCSKLVKIPLKDVVLKIYDYFNKKNEKFIGLSEIYDFLREEFNMKSFNRANLIALLNTQSEVDFNTVKDLYIQHVVSCKDTETVNFEILDTVFIERKEYLIRTIEVLGLDVIKDILLNGPKKYYDFVSCFVESDNLTDLIKENKAKLLYSFISQFEESKLIEMLQNEDYITKEVFNFKQKNEKKSKIKALKDKIAFSMNYIHADNLNLNVKYLFTAPLSSILYDNHIYQVVDFHTLSDVVADSLLSHEESILAILKSLQFSLKERYNDEFKLLLQQINKQNKPHRLWENYVSILEHRAKGKTLEATGDIFDVTRERVRQLEKRYFDDFKLFYSGMNKSANLLRSMMENELFVLDSDIIKLFPANPLLFKYFLLNVDNDNLEYLEELGKFYFVDDYNWYNDACLYIDALPEQMREDELNESIVLLQNRLADKGISISETDCKKLILTTYRQSGDIFSKNKMNLMERYRYIWRENFPEVVNIYDETFLSKFKKIYGAVFDDDKEYGVRAIVGILTRIGLVCGRGEYRLNDRIFMSEQLAQKIYAYIIESGRQTFLTNTLFSIFYNELQAEGITNKYFLQGALKQHFDSKLYFRRDYVSTTAGDFNIYSDVFNYVKNANTLLDYEEIKNAFEGATDIILALALSQEGILGYRKKYIHIDALNISKDERDYLKYILEQLVSDNEIHHTNQLLQYLKLANNDLLKKLFITEQFALFSLIQALFENEFEFKRPFIANKNVIIGNQTERIQEFVESKEVCLIEELLDFIYESQMHIYSILDCVNSLEGYIFKDETCIILEERTNVNKYNVATIEKLIEKEIGDNEFIFVEKLKSFPYFPTEVKWTDWLLYSAVNKYGNTFNVISSSNMFKMHGVIFAKPILVKKSLNIKSIDELKSYLKKQLNLSETEFFVYLKNKGLA